MLRAAHGLESRNGDAARSRNEDAARARIKN